MIYNETKRIIITKEEVFLIDSIKQAIGLMFRSSKAIKDRAWIFYMEKPSKNTIHSYFMRYPIRLIFLDSSDKVIEVAILEPWNIYKPEKAYDSLIELDLFSEEIAIGDQLEYYEYV